MEGRKEGKESISWSDLESVFFVYEKFTDYDGLSVTCF